MTHNNRLWLLISRRLSGEASPAEERELQELLRQAPDKHQLLDILHTFFAAPVPGADMDLADRDLEQRFRRIVRHEPRNDRKTAVISRRLLYYAAAFAGAAFLAWGAWGVFFRYPTTAQALPAERGGEVVARPGVRTRLLLPDGTQVWLNSNSKLKYAADFNRRSREVELEGEAYFDVVRDAARPFIVHASAIDVRVLGTAFTVKSYPQDETIEATLLKGAIEVSGRDDPNSPRVILKPDEKVVLDKHLLTVPVSAPVKSSGLAGRKPVLPDISVNPVPANIPDSEKVETSWLYNRLVFNGDAFKELAEKMERWYDVKIVFQDEDLYKYRFAGAFANESVQDALNALQLTAPFNYKISGNVIEIDKK